ncbi:hypothetical protein P8452_25978 [Trifolium repens]|nr:hypothetical protein P8452_25978 [Trifolium repens]
MCSSVPADVRQLMQQSLDGVVVKKRKRQKIEDEIMNVNPLATVLNGSGSNQMDVNLGVQSFGVHDSAGQSSGQVLHTPGDGMSKNVERRKKIRATKNNNNNNHAAAAAAAVVYTTNSEPEPVVAPMEKSALIPKKVDSRIHMAIGRFLYDIGAPFDAVNSVYFDQMVEAIASGGSDFQRPSHHELRGWVLKNSLEDVKNEIDRFHGYFSGMDGLSIFKENSRFGNVRYTKQSRLLVTVRFDCSPDTSSLENPENSFQFTSKEQESNDPLSFDNIYNVEDWIRPRDLYQEYGNSDWMALDSSSINTMLLRPLNNEPEEMCEGFDDQEIFISLKNGEDEHI